MKALKRIVGSELFRIGSLNSISMMLKIAIGVVTSKIIAVFIGPSGLALVANLRNFMAALETVSTLGYQTGVVKYVASHENKPNQLARIISTVFICLLATCLVISPLLYFGAASIAANVFDKDFQYIYIFRVLAAALPWFAASVLLNAVLTGLGRYRHVIYISIAGNIIGLVLTVVLVTLHNTEGALLALIISPAVVFIASAWFALREISLLRAFSVKLFSPALLKRLSTYSLMGVVSALLAPMVMLWIRNVLIDEAGIIQAGYWEAITRISIYYMMFVTAILSVYFLPKLSAATTDSGAAAVIQNYYKGVLPLFFIGLAVLYLFRDTVMEMLFTSEFKAVGNLFVWQLAGDLFKAGALVLGYTLVARRAVAMFIVTEFVSMGIMYFISLILIPDYGVEAVVMAHFFTYVIYLLILAVYFRKLLFTHQRTANDL